MDCEHKALHVISELKKYLNGLANIDLNSLKVLKYFEILRDLITQNSQLVFNLMNKEKFIVLVIKSSDVWLTKDYSLVDEIMIFLTVVLSYNISNTKFLSFLSNQGGISFCLLTLKLQLTSLISIRCALDYLTSILAFDQNRRIKSIKFDSSISSIVTQPTSKSLLVQQLLSNAAGYCLPRAFHIVTNKCDSSSSSKCISSIEFLIDNTPLEYIIKLIEFDNYTVIKSLNRIFAFASLETKLQSLKLLLKLLSLDNSIARRLVDHNLWISFDDALKLYGQDIKNVDSCFLSAIKMLRSVSNIPLISQSLTIMEAIKHDEIDEERENNKLKSLDVKNNDKSDDVDGINYFQQVDYGNPYTSQSVGIKFNDVEIWPTISEYNNFGFCPKEDVTVKPLSSISSKDMLELSLIGNMNNSYLYSSPRSISSKKSITESIASTTSSSILKFNHYNNVKRKRLLKNIYNSENTSSSNTDTILSQVTNDEHSLMLNSIIAARNRTIAEHIFGVKKEESILPNIDLPMNNSLTNSGNFADKLKEMIAQINSVT